MLVCRAVPPVPVAGGLQFLGYSHDAQHPSLEVSIRVEVVLTIPGKTQ